MKNNRENKKQSGKKLSYKKPSPAICFLLRFFFGLISKFLYRPQVLRNEIRNLDGPFLLIANHQSALDIVNISIQYKKRLTVVFGSNYYYSLPKTARILIDACGVIHKQQFQTRISDLKKMKGVIKAGAPLLIFPAGLMCEDGLSTPIPEATASFIKWLGVDVYMAKSIGTYFVMPKWSDRKRRGKTKLDIFRIFSAEELKQYTKSELKEKIDDKLYFDAYEEQETERIHFRHGDDTEGLENVVYQCPVCRTKYSIVSDKNRLTCSSCGFSQTMDTKGFLHCENSDMEVRHISDWTRWILNRREHEITENFSMTLFCYISIMDGRKTGFRPAGKGTVTLNNDAVVLNAILDERSCVTEKSVKEFPTLPFVPGKCFEIQDGSVSYRCFPEKPEMVMEWINTLKILHKKSYNDKRILLNR